MSTQVMQPTQTQTPAFDSLLAPVSSDLFFESYWQKEFLFIDGSQDKFDSIFSWHLLDRILMEHRMKPPRLRMFRAGNALDPRIYLEFSDKGEPQINASALRRELSAGATVVVDRVDEIIEPIKRLVARMERFLHSRVWVNLYAGWGSEKGFDLHFDSHDVFILQVTGKKQWKVYRPSDTNPSLAPKGNEECREDCLVWDGMIRQGGLFYIPEGWWHIAWPQGEPSIHLTFGTNAVTSAEFIAWLADEYFKTFGKSHVPIRTGVRERSAFAKDVSRKITRLLDEDAVDHFIAFIDRNARTRPELNLRDTVGLTPDSISPEHKARLVGARNPALIIGEDDKTTIWLGQQLFEVPTAITRLLAAMEDGDEHSLAEVLAPSHRESAKSAEVLYALLDHGIIAIRS